MTIEDDSPSKLAEPHGIEPHVIEPRVIEPHVIRQTHVDGRLFKGVAPLAVLALPVWLGVYFYGVPALRYIYHALEKELTRRVPHHMSDTGPQPLFRLTSGGKNFVVRITNG